MPLAPLDYQQRAGPQLHLSAAAALGNDCGASRSTDDEEPLFRARVLVRYFFIACSAGPQFHDRRLRQPRRGDRVELSAVPGQL